MITKTYILMNVQALISILASGEELALLCRVVIRAGLLTLSTFGEILALYFLFILSAWHRRKWRLLLLRLHPDVVFVGCQVNDTSRFHHFLLILIKAVLISGDFLLFESFIHVSSLKFRFFSLFFDH